LYGGQAYTTPLDEEEGEQVDEYNIFKEVTDINGNYDLLVKLVVFYDRIFNSNYHIFISSPRVVSRT
jgi:hypothetical protein